MHGGAALSFFRYERLVLGLGGINRAGTGAGAAIDAGIGIDDELAVTLGNSLNGAVAGASATGDAIIGDNICHDNSLLSNDGYVSILSHFCKNAMGDTQNLHFFHRVMSAMRFFRLSAAMVNHLGQLSSMRLMGELGSRSLKPWKLRRWGSRERKPS